MRAARLGLITWFMSIEPKFESHCPPSAEMLPKLPLKLGFFVTQLMVPPGWGVLLWAETGTAAVRSNTQQPLSAAANNGKRGLGYDIFIFGVFGDLLLNVAATMAIFITGPRVRVRVGGGVTWCNA